MSVFVYNQSGAIIEERPDAEIAQVGKEIYQFNKAHPQAVRKMVKAESFPPPGMVFDATSGDLRPKSVADVYASGMLGVDSSYALQQGPAGARLVGLHEKLDANGEVVEKTASEKIAAGLLAFDPATQKIENEQVVPKNRQELLTEGHLTYDQLRDDEIKRLRREVEAYFDQNKTTNGYRLDNLARQKAALTMQYRSLPDTDPVKADLLSKQLIYTDAICDEILAKAEIVQAAYSQAKTAVDNAHAQQKTVAEFEAIQIANYL